MNNLSLSLFEIIFLFISAMVVGFVINLFINSRKSMKRSMEEGSRSFSGIDDWKLKYLNEMEVKDKELETLRNNLHEAEENNRVHQVELNELKHQVRKLTNELQQAETVKAQPASKPDYFAQLTQAHRSLVDHQEKINKLLEQVDVIKDTEEKSLEIQKSNEELIMQIKDMRYMLEEKEMEINDIRKKENLTREMTSMLDNAYSEFNLLQEKMRKLESQLASSKMVNIEYEDLKEAYYKMTRELDEARDKINHYMQENQQLQINLTKMEDKFNEANQQRLQLQKKVTYLEELTNDLHLMSEANKKLETQIRRIGELESKLNLVSEERDKLKENKPRSL